MKYLIAREVSGCSAEIPIDELRYKRVLDAKSGLIFEIELEEKLALVLENYFELELNILGLGLRWAIHEDWRWETLQRQALAINMKLVNFLNSVWMYRDHVSRSFDSVANVVGVERQRELRRLLEGAFDDNGLSAILVLRNYCQHKGLAVEGVGYKSGWLDSRNVLSQIENPRSFVTADLSISISDIERASGPDSQYAKLAKVLRESGCSKWDPREHLRRSVDEITGFHSAMRLLLEGLHGEWISSLEAILEDARQNGLDVCGLAVVQLRGDGEYEGWCHIFRELLTRRDELISTNGGATLLASKTITSSPL